MNRKVDPEDEEGAGGPAALEEALFTDVEPPGPRVATVRPPSPARRAGP